MKATLKIIAIFSVFYLQNTFAQHQSLTNVGVVPNYDSKEIPFKISGALYMSDGVTPAKNYILTINQANEKGDFIVDKNGNLITAASMITDSDGKYTFYTFVPGNDRRYNRLQEIFMKVETPTGNTYAMPTLLFDTDPMLTKRCRKQIAKRSDASRILKLVSENDKHYVKRNMVLNLDLDRIN